MAHAQSNAQVRIIWAGTAITVTMFFAYMVSWYRVKYGMASPTSIPEMLAYIALQAILYWYLVCASARVFEGRKLKYLGLTFGALVSAVITITLVSFDHAIEQGHQPPWWLHWMIEPANVAAPGMATLIIATLAGIILLGVYDLAVLITRRALIWKRSRAHQH